MRAHTHADPETKDGRNVDPELGTLSGEASHLEVRKPMDRAYPTSKEVERENPLLDPRDASPTYYEQPAIKEPVWKAPIPLYFYVGGLAGGSAALGAAAQLFGGPELQRLAKRCQWIATFGAATSAGLLIWDLGRRGRFIYMLRVFRPTSPMNIGTWILSAFGAASATAALLQGRRTPLALLGERAGIAAGALGGPLSVYTSVLISNTAVPVWQGARNRMPLVFAASSATSVAAVLDFFELSPVEERVVFHFGVAAKVAELAAARSMEHELSKQPRGMKPYKEGLSGALWTAAKMCVAASLVTSILPLPVAPRTKRRVSGLLGTIGCLATRLAIFRAGTSSARDPRATFESQRAGLGGEEATRKPAVAGTQPRREAQAPGSLQPAAHP